MHAFVPADILIPKEALLERWSVVACDQFTADRAYWNRVRKRTAGVPSAMHLILPEAELGTSGVDAAIRTIPQTMVQYLEGDIFRSFPRAYVYVERRLADGSIRPGLVGAVDLEQYSSRPEDQSPVRATEETVPQRLPVRQQLRRGAALEISHGILLCDDPENHLLGPVTNLRDDLPKLYDFPLMEHGGQVAGWLLTGEPAGAFARRLEAYARSRPPAVPLLAVGDGNHSLAAAKACYEALKRQHPNRDFSGHPGRFALMELENLRHPAIKLEPIHRVVLETEPEQLYRDLLALPGGTTLEFCSRNRQAALHSGGGSEALPTAAVQRFLDRWLQTHPGKLDYIHGAAEAAALARNPGAAALLLPPLPKEQLFRGTLFPRKTFSLGSAREKRYYLEGRKII